MTKKQQRPTRASDAVDRYRIKMTVLRHDWRLYGVRSAPHREWFRRVLSDQLYQVAYDPEFLEESDVESAVEACEELGIEDSPFAQQLREMRDAENGVDQYRQFMRDHIVELGDAYSADAVTHHFETLIQRLALSGDVSDIPESAIAGSSVLLDRRMLTERSIDLVFAHVEEEMDLLISDEISTSLSLDDLQPVWKRTHLALEDSSRTLFALSAPFMISGTTIDFDPVGNKCGHGWDERLA
ncbi:MAG: hypothetical protein ACPHN2_04425 [Sinimarinibacterium flocculans]|uniref:hypothetical protein n=1 Tax=Sinimarinibacterium flocculans TaxID=985250 RepID=UPI003C455F80